jgi:Holliday junction resolvase
MTTKRNSTVFQSESVFQHRLLRELRLIPNSWWVVKEAGAIRGLPDIFGCIKGRLILLEVKKSKSESLHTTGRIVLQRYQLEQAQKADAFCRFVYPENHIEILSELLLLSC